MPFMFLFPMVNIPTPVYYPGSVSRYVALPFLVLPLLFLLFKFLILLVCLWAILFVAKYLCSLLVVWRHFFKKQIKGSRECTTHDCKNKATVMINANFLNKLFGIINTEFFSFSFIVSFSNYMLRLLHRL